jgi:Arc/MetJ-type ribon-helix-helix transcriptional regulator
MRVELQPETERLVQEEIRAGHFRSVDELIVQSVRAWLEKYGCATATSQPRKSFYELLTQPPFAGSNLDLERQKDFPGPLEL